MTDQAGDSSPACRFATTVVHLMSIIESINGCFEWNWNYTPTFRSELESELDTHFSLTGPRHPLFAQSEVEPVPNLSLPTSGQDDGSIFVSQEGIRTRSRSARGVPAGANDLFARESSPLHSCGSIGAVISAPRRSLPEMQTFEISFQVARTPSGSLSKGDGRGSLDLEPLSARALRQCRH